MWKHKLRGAGIKGTANIVGPLSGVVTRVIDNFNGNVYRICSVVHQLDPTAAAIFNQ